MAYHSLPGTPEVLPEPLIDAGDPQATVDKMRTTRVVDICPGTPFQQLAGIAGGGVIGLFLLGLGLKRVRPWQAVVAVVVSILSIVWATFARDLSEPWSFLECTWHTRMIGVIGTVTLLVVGLALALIPLPRSRRSKNAG